MYAKINSNTMVREKFSAYPVIFVTPAGISEADFSFIHAEVVLLTLSLV